MLDVHISSSPRTQCHLGATRVNKTFCLHGSRTETVSFLDLNRFFDFVKLYWHLNIQYHWTPKYKRCSPPPVLHFIRLYLILHWIQIHKVIHVHVTYHLFRKHEAVSEMVLCSSLNSGCHVCYNSRSPHCVRDASYVQRVWEFWMWKKLFGHTDDWILTPWLAKCTDTDSNEPVICHRCSTHSAGSVLFLDSESYGRCHGVYILYSLWWQSVAAA